MKKMPITRRLKFLRAAFRSWRGGAKQLAAFQWRVFKEGR